MKKISLLIFVLFAAFNTWAQDPHFSQFFSSPLTLNPALTGKFNGDLRFAANYRNQWPTIDRAFVTTTASLDMSVLKRNLPDVDQMGVGILLLNDKAGNGAITSNYIAASLAYHKGLDEDALHSLSLGFQGTLMNKRLNTSMLTFQDQLTPFGFTGVTQESFSDTRVKLNYFDFNAGLLYTGTTNGLNSIYLGGSLYHANRPKETFMEGNFLLNSRFTIHGGARLPIGEYDGLHLSAQYSRQANASHTIIGGAYSYNFNGDTERPNNIYLGSWFRLGDAFIPYVSIEFGDWQFGASYDINMSQLKTASNLRGGIEISLIYTRSHVDPNIKKLNCPKF